MFRLTLSHLSHAFTTGQERLIRARLKSKFHLIRSYCEIFFYNFPNIPCLKYTVNSNFHLIRSKTLLTNDFELTVPDLYWFLPSIHLHHHFHPDARACAHSLNYTTDNLPLQESNRATIAEENLIGC